MNVIDRLNSLKVADVVSSQVIAVGACETLDEAAAVLHKHRISGAPVVDDKGRCVGVLTANDFVNHRADQHGRERWERGTDHRLDICETGSPYRLHHFDSGRVAERMTTAIQTVDLDTSLLKAANEMCLAHIHHLIVLDKTGRPAGIMSALDIVSALTKAVEEGNRPRRST